MKNILRVAFAVAAVTVSLTGAAVAQEWPTRAVEVSVFSSAGGTTDFVNRLVASYMEPAIGVSVPVVNRTGGGGAVAMNYIWSQPHNGLYWLGASEAMQAAAVMGFSTLTTDDFHWYMVAGAPGSLAVPADSPYQTLEDFLKDAKERPGAINVSHSNLGSVWHLKTIALMNATDVSLNAIPFEGSNPAMVAALSGESQAVISSMSEQAEYLRSGKMRSLGVVEMLPFTSPTGVTFPAIGATYPKINDIPASQWVGFALPKDTPPEVLAKIDASFDEVMQDEKLRATLEENWLGIFALRGEASSEVLHKMESAVAWKLNELGIAPGDPEALGIARP